MIGSHDSFTYKSPENPIFKLFSFLWKTQNKSLKEQYDLGVRMFDLRVRYTKNKLLQPCHGIVDLGPGRYANLYSLVHTIHAFYPEAYFRIILEKGDETKFINECYLIKDEPYITQLAIKKNWKVIKPSTIGSIDYFWCPFYSNYSFIDNIKNWWKTTKFITIKQYTKKAPKITKEMIDSKDIIYYYDYI